MFLDVVEISRSRVHYHYFLIYSLEIFNVKFTFQNIFIFSLLRTNVYCGRKKCEFTADKIYFHGKSNLTPDKIPSSSYEGSG